MKRIVLVALLLSAPSAFAGPEDYAEGNPAAVARERANFVCLRALHNFTQGVLLFIAKGGDRETVVRENTREPVEGMPDSAYTLAVVDAIFKRDAAAYRSAAEAFADHCTDVVAPHIDEE